MLFFSFKTKSSGADKKIAGQADTEQLADAHLGPQGQKRAQEDE